MTSDHLTEGAVAAFLAAVAVALRDIDETSPEQHPSTRFVAVVDAALEHISQWGPDDLQNEDRDGLHRISRMFHQEIRNSDIPGAENFL